jgi:hypothetical protein
VISNLFFLETNYLFVVNTWPVSRAFLFLILFYTIFSRFISSYIDEM